MDPRSITAQPEDTLTIYAAAGAPVLRCSAAKEPLISESPFRKVYKVEHPFIHYYLYPGTPYAYRSYYLFDS